MIVRISTEGQYELADAAVAAVNELDNELVAACEARDERLFAVTFDRLLELVRGQGRSVAEGDLRGSDVILPPPDTTMDEAAGEFHGEGLIPG